MRSRHEAQFLCPQKMDTLIADQRLNTAFELQYMRQKTSSTKQRAGISSLQSFSSSASHCHHKLGDSEMPLPHSFWRIDSFWWQQYSCKKKWLLELDKQKTEAFLHSSLFFCVLSLLSAHNALFILRLRIIHLLSYYSNRNCKLQFWSAVLKRLYLLIF